jgi:hypothetical protein
MRIITILAAGAALCIFCISMKEEICKEYTMQNAERNAEYYVLHKNLEVKNVSCTSSGFNKAICALVDNNHVSFVECSKTRVEPFKSCCRPVPRT